MSSSPTGDINDYLDGLLSQEDRAAFEAELSRSPKLRKQLTLERQIRATLGEQSQDDDLRSMIEVAKNQQKTSTASHDRPRRLIRWMAAAAALLLLIAGTWLFVRPPSPGTAELAQRYGSLNHPAGILPTRTLRNNDATRLAPPSNNSTKKTDTTKELSSGILPLSRARILLTRDSFRQALESYKAIPANAMTDSLRFETALTHLQLNQSHAALALLNELPEEPFAGGPYWYRAIAYLQLGEADSARTQLQALVSEYNRPYRKHALQLLDEL